MERFPGSSKAKGGVVPKSAITVMLLCSVAGTLSASAGSASEGGSGGPYGTGLKLGTKVLSSAPVGASVGPWYLWNRSACKFDIAAKHPTAYKAEVRNIVGGDARIGYMHYGNSDPFGIANSKSVAEWAKKAGMPLDVYNLKFPSRTEPLADARIAVTKNDRGVLQANLDSTMLPAFFK